MRKRISLLAGAAAVVVALPTSAYAAPGDSWRPVTFLPIQGIEDFDAVGAAEVWHVGTDYDITKGVVPGIFQWTGGLSWKRHAPPDLPPNGRLTDVTAQSGDEVWVAGFYRSSDYFLTGFTYLASSSPLGVWSKRPVPQPPIETEHRELVSDSAGMWLTEGGRISRWDGTVWTTVATLTRNIERLESFGPDNAWIAAGDEVWHWDGSSWQQIPRPDGITGQRVRFTADGAWTATTSGLRTWDGSSWQTTAYPAPFDGATFSTVNGLTDSDGQWVSLKIREGEGGLLHWDGSEWTRYPLMADTTQQVVVDDAGRIWGVNRISRLVSTLPTGGYLQHKGQIVRFKDGAWESVGAAEADYRLTHLPGSDRLYGFGENEWNGADKAVTNR